MAGRIKFGVCICVVVAVLLQPIGWELSVPSVRAQKSKDEDVDFSLFLSRLRRGLESLAVPILREDDPNPLLRYAVAPNTLRIKGSVHYRLVRGRLVITGSAERSVGTLEFEGVYDVAVGEARVRQVKKLMGGEEKK